MISKKLSFLLIVMLLSSALVYVVSESETSEAADTVTEKGLTYTLVNKGGDGENTAEITAIVKAKLESEVIIPAYVEYDGEKYHVTAVNTTFPGYNNKVKTIVIEDNPGLILKASIFKSNYITSAKIGEGVTLCENMFSGCKKLTAVTLAEGITTIPDGAFYNCTKLVDFELPSSVERIGANAFKNCSSLSGLKLESIKAIGIGAFSGTQFSSLEISANLIEIGIGPGCFLDDLDAISVPEENPAFTVENGILYNKDKTELLYFPRTITTTDGTFTTSANIGDYAFYNTLLKKIIVEEGATSIGAYAFANCNTLEEIELGNSISTIGKYAFSHTTLKNINLPSKLTTVAEGLFHYCSNLEKITIPEKVDMIGENAFLHCDSLHSVNILGDPTSIGSQSFYECGELTDINLPNSITSIDGKAFYNDKKVIITALPANLETVKQYAFENCSCLTIDELPSKLTEIGEKSFYNTGIVKITVGEENQITFKPGSESKNHLYAFGGESLQSICLNNVTVEDKKYYGNLVGITKNLKEFTLGEKFKLWSWDEGGLGVDIDTKTAFLADPSKDTITIPLSVETLYGTGFQGSVMKVIDYEGDPSRTITFDNAISPSDNLAGTFYMSKYLEKVTLPNIQLKNTNNYLLDRCTNLRDVEIAKLTSPSSSPFYYGTTLSKLVIHEGTKITSLPSAYYVQFPQDLTAMNKYKWLYDSDGTAISNNDAESVSKVKGSTFVWTGTYSSNNIPNLIKVSENQIILCLDYGTIKTYIAVDKDSTLDLSKYVYNIYTVQKWYTDAQRTKEYVPSAVTEPFTLYADLTPSLFTITNNSSEVTIMNNGKIVNNGDKVAYGEVLQITAKEKEGYHITLEYGDKNVQYNNAHETVEYTVTSDTAVSLTYRRNAAMMMFNVVGSEAIDPIIGYCGDEYAKPADPSKTGYTFVGWSPALPDTIPITNVSSIIGNPAAKYTYTALWRPDSVNISFNSTGGNEIPSDSRLYNTMYGSLPTPVKTGYSFLGWFTDIENETPINYKDIVKASDTVVLYAKWNINQYTLSFNTSGGTEIASITMDYGTALTSPSAPSKDGYAFQGWDQEIPATMPAEDLIISAIWAPILSADEKGNLSVDASVSGDTFVINGSETKVVSVSIGKNTSVKIQNASDLSGKTVVSKIDSVNNGSTVTGTAYEFVFTADGKNYNGRMSVTLPYTQIDGKEAAVYYWDGNTATKMNVTDRGEDYVTFDTDHNSTYIVSSEDLPEDHDTIVYIAVVAIVLVVIIASVVAVIYHRRNA